MTARYTLVKMEIKSHKSLLLKFINISVVGQLINIAADKMVLRTRRRDTPARGRGFTQRGGGWCQVQWSLGTTLPGGSATPRKSLVQNKTPSSQRPGLWAGLWLKPHARSTITGRNCQEFTQVTVAQFHVHPFIGVILYGLGLT